MIYRLILCGCAVFGLTITPMFAQTATTNPPSTTQEKPKAETATPETNQNQRTQLNLLGQTDTNSGESRRNENVQFNLIDNNVLRELNLRVGTTATIIAEFNATRNFFGAEYGAPPAPSVHLPRSKTGGIHGSLFETHNNSIFSARAFFQVGDVKPARENNYGFNLGIPLTSRTYLLLDGTQQKMRGFVNGNVLVPTADERTPLATADGAGAMGALDTAYGKVLHAFVPWVARVAAQAPRAAEAVEQPAKNGP